MPSKLPSNWNDKYLRVLALNVGVDLKKVPFEEFKLGMQEELEHDDITNRYPVMTAKIAAAHLREDPRYYTKLKKALAGKKDEARLPMIKKPFWKLSEYIPEACDCDADDSADLQKRGNLYLQKSLTADQEPVKEAALDTNYAVVAFKDLETDADPYVTKHLTHNPSVTVIGLPESEPEARRMMKKFSQRAMKTNIDFFIIASNKHKFHVGQELKYSTALDLEV
jgi:hypothetical protein